MTRIALIGAGSVVFTKTLLTDILSFPELRGAPISLHDIDPERLETAGMMARWTSDRLGAGARVEEHPDRRAALEGADFVINMVQIGMHEATLLDFEIPKKYGLKQTIADSMVWAASSAACAPSPSCSTWPQKCEGFVPRPYS